MICIPAIVICGECKDEVEQRIPIQHGMMNMLIIDTRVSPEGWGYKANQLVCPTCLGTTNLKLVVAKKE